ncbi:MAG: exonuclease domain-containing protein [Paracoccaceae bacterium]
MGPDRLSLRLRVFLFFAALALAGVALTGGALWLGWRRSGGEADGFILAFVVSAFGLTALCAGIWLLFDENVARPIERLAVALRCRAHAGVATGLDEPSARYLGDLASAAAAMSGKLGAAEMAQAAEVAAATERLEAERTRLTALLTEIPLATVLAGPGHRIVLYDAQAAAILGQFGTPRLGASLTDYFQAGALEAAQARLARSGQEIAARLPGARGGESVEVRLCPLDGAGGYLMVIDAAHTDLPPDAARPLVYDFDLLAGPADAAFDARPLRDLAFAVFDTETTGLLPHRDEIVQIAAVRVVRGRIVPGEALDLLVDPGIPIPASASRVHGITDAMVAGAPGVDSAARAFHDFAREAVIVAHNAPFDLAFLRRVDTRLGLGWDHPILDTVLLSAVLFGASETHSLDALCERLGVTIPEADRHTAMGDARATAQAFCRMLPMLEARGLDSFGAVVAETRRHGRLLEDLN